MSQTLDAPAPVTDPVDYGEEPKQTDVAFKTPGWLYVVRAA